MENSPNPPHILQTSFRTLAVATAVLYLALAGLTVWSRHDSVRNTHALCAFKGELESRVAIGTQFLLTHPHGVPGISANILIVGIRNEQATIHALRFLSC